MWGHVDTDCDDLNNFYAQDKLRAPYLSDLSYAQDVLTPPTNIPNPKNLSPATADSDATVFMRDGFRQQRPPSTCPLGLSHNSRQRKVWKKFRTFKKQLNKLATANNGDPEGCGTTIKTLGFV